MSSNDSYDEDLKQAIALSLADSEGRGNCNKPIVIANSPPSSASVPNPIIDVPVSEPRTGLAALDRKAMEAERLARLNKMYTSSVSPPPLRATGSTPAVEANTVALPSGARLTTFTALVDKDQKDRKTPAAQKATNNLKRPFSEIENVSESNKSDDPSHPPGNLAYLNGVVKKTWAYGFDRKDDVKLEEVLEPNTLRTAVLSAFQWDVQWIMSKLKTPGNSRGVTKCIFIMQAKEQDLQDQMLQETESYRSFLRLCFPSMRGMINCMHSKLMLLFHKEKLRIAIPTANLLPFDWGETGVMENSVFMIDLPRIEGGVKVEADDLTDFARELLFFLEKQGVERAVRDGLLGFDFTATKPYAFVHTVGGANYGEDAIRTGITGLSHAVRRLKLQATSDLQIDFAASSIGSLNDTFLESFHAGARGEDPEVTQSANANEAKNNFFSKSRTKERSTSNSAIREKVRIYFPTKETVSASIARAAGTICLSRKWFEGPNFPRSCFRDYKSTRTGILSHNKILYARGFKCTEDEGTTSTSTKPVAWMYVGSANVSASAWGERVYDRKQHVWKLNCRNWECGVLLPVPEDHLGGDERDHKRIKPEPSAQIKKEEEESETESEDERDEPKSSADASKALPSRQLVGMEVFDTIFKPPFEIPGDRYGNRQPWYFQEHG